MADDTVKRCSVSGRRDSRDSFKAGSGFDQYRIENREGHEEHPIMARRQGSIPVASTVRKKVDEM